MPKSTLKSIRQLKYMISLQERAISLLEEEILKRKQIISEYNNQIKQLHL